MESQMDIVKTEELLRIHELRVNKLTAEGSECVLDIDELSIREGETLGIVGESGAGKTVLALSILGLLPSPPGKILSGEIIFKGINLREQSEKFMSQKIRGRKIAMIFQDPMSTLNPVFTVGTQIIRVIRTGEEISSKDAQLRAVEILNQVRLPDPEAILQKYPHQLSGGQRQRIIIAMALACRAEFIIADEPTRNLDVTIQASILLLFKELQRELGITVLFIANNLGLVSAFCDRLAILQKGRIIEQGAVREVLSQPADDYTKLLIRFASQESTREARETGDVLLKVTGLKKYFPVERTKERGLFVKAVDGVDMEVRSGEIIGIVGESGCGKSTLVNTILNLHPPTEGRVIFDGQDIFELKGDMLREARKKIQIVFQDPYWSLNPRWLIRDIIAEPLRVHEHLTAAEELERVEELLNLVGLKSEHVFLYPYEFSGGERQRIAIARSLAVSPKLVVLDEPTSAVDILSQAQILELIEDLRGRFGLTNLLISHDLGVVSRLADRIVVMYLGKVVETGVSADIFRAPLHPYTKALFDSIPRLNEGIEKMRALEGEIPSAINPPSGCPFHPRCARAVPRCSKECPVFAEVEPGHRVSCFLYE